MAYYMMDGVRTDKQIEQAQFFELLKGHEEMIRRGVADGTVLLAGPKLSSPGGYVILNVENREQAEAFFANDPFKLSGLQEYYFTEFRIHEGQECLTPYLSK